MIQEMNSWQSLTADGATNSPLKWELNGYRYYRNGEVYIDSIFGAYWTAESYSQQSAYYLYIYGDVADIGVYYKANGQSIRCIMD